MEVKPEAKPRKHATRAEVVKIHNLMSQHITVVSQGLCAYSPGWSDDRIAEEVGVKKSSVQHSRNQIFGKLYQRDPEPPSMFVNSMQLEALESRVETLSRQLSHLYERLGATPPV